MNYKWTITEVRWEIHKKYIQKDKRKNKVVVAMSGHKNVKLRLNCSYQNEHNILLTVRETKYR